MNWNKKNIDSTIVRALFDTYNIDLITASILARRGVVQPDEIKFYLETDLGFLHNPFLFDDMESAVDRILETVDEEGKIRIFGDRDADGMTATVLLYEALHERGADVDWQLPEGDEPYGLTKEGVDRFAGDSGSLIITVDCGISNTVEIAYARSLGIDTIIIDHHLSDSVLPPAYAIINPRIQGCGYPFSQLAGCGVVAKVVWALNFAATELYKQEIVLLHAEPGNDTVIIQAVKLENLVEVDRLTEEIVPGIINLAGSRLADFLIGLPILTYNRDTEYRMLRQAFGAEVEIHLLDTAAKIWNTFPKLRGKSLPRLKQISKSLKYSSREIEELDVFISLFIAYYKQANPSLSTEYEKILDLVAIGTIADLMPMINENRILVRRGMQQLTEGNRNAITAFFGVQNLLGKKISTTDIGWQVSPVFNAAGRLGVPGKTVDLLLESDSERCHILSRELVMLNRERKKIGDQAWVKLFPKAEKSYNENRQRFILLTDRDLNRGITGIIAARLMNHFNVPAVVIARLENKWIGSVRSNVMLNVKEFLAEFDDLLIDYGGHPRAGGFSVSDHNLEVLLKRMYQTSREMKESRVDESLQIDAEIPHEYMNPSLIDVVERLEPYGEENRPLQFLLQRANIESVSLIGNGEVRHLKLLVSSGKYKWPAVYWKAGERLGSLLQPGHTVDIVFRLGRNYYRNTENLQLTVIDLKLSNSGAVDKAQ